MQNLTIAQTLTMSSREIAELTEKQHKHVLEDCRKMFEALNIVNTDRILTHSAKVKLTHPL